MDSFDLRNIYHNDSDDQLLLRWEKLEDYTPEARKLILMEIRERVDLSHRIEVTQASRKKEEQTAAAARHNLDKRFRMKLVLRLEELLPQRTFKIFGVACWRNFETIATSYGLELAAEKLMHVKVSAHLRRFGIIAATNDELYVVDAGELPEWMIGIDDVIQKLPSASVSSYPLDELSASCEQSVDDLILSIDGAVSMKATFPEFVEIINPISAERICTAIQESTQFVCPDCNCEVAPDAKVCSHCGTKCDE